MMKEITRKWILTRAFLVFFLLLTPIIEVLLVPLKVRYNLGSAVSEMTLKLAYIGKKTFSTEGQIDILFAGPSSIMVGVNARQIQEILRYIMKKNDISVENFAHPRMGYESDYYILRDLISRRKVKAVILGVENRGQTRVHRITRFIWNPLTDWEPAEISAEMFAEKFLDSLSTIVRFYSGEKHDVPPKDEKYNGGFLKTHGYSEGHLQKAFVTKKMQPPILNLESFHLRPEDSIETGIYPAFQEHFLKKIIDLAHENNILLYLMHTPSIHHYPMSKVPVSSFREKSSVDVPVLGISTSRFFNTTNWEDVHDFYFNEEHFNANGAAGFSQFLVSPMKEVYEKTNR